VSLRRPCYTGPAGGADGGGPPYVVATQPHLTVLIQKAALDLLLDLMAADGACLREGARLLTLAHFETTSLDTTWNHQQQSTARWGTLPQKVQPPRVSEASG